MTARQRERPLKPSPSLATRAGAPPLPEPKAQTSPIAKAGIACRAQLLSAE
jgi:hypothetical protein